MNQVDKTAGRSLPRLWTAEGFPLSARNRILATSVIVTRAQCPYQLLVGAQSGGTGGEIISTKLTARYMPRYQSRKPCCRRCKLLQWELLPLEITMVSKSGSMYRAALYYAEPR